MLPLLCDSVRLRSLARCSIVGEMMTMCICVVSIRFRPSFPPPPLRPCIINVIQMIRRMNVQRLRHTFFENNHTPFAFLQGKKLCPRGHLRVGDNFAAGFNDGLFAIDETTVWLRDHTQWFMEENLVTSLCDFHSCNYH